MSNERQRVLEMLAQGKITVEQADRLLRALAEQADAPETGAATPPSGQQPKFLRINVHKPGHEGRKDKDVNIRVPLSVIRGGMRLGTMIPGLHNVVGARLRNHGMDLDFDKMDAAAIEDLLKNMGELHIDVNPGGESVRISCE